MDGATNRATLEENLQEIGGCSSFQKHSDPTARAKTVWFTYKHSDVLELPTQSKVELGICGQPWCSSALRLNLQNEWAKF